MTARNTVTDMSLECRHDDELAVTSISRLIMSMSLPSIIGVLAYNLYNILDTLLLSQGAGMDAVGGVAVSFPLFMLLSAVASTLGTGAASVISRALGRGDDEQAARAAANTFLVFYATALAMTVVGLLFLDPILLTIGVTDSLLPVARGYTRIILIGAVTSTGFSNLIRAEGASRYAMAIWVIPLSVNTAFDILFIFGLEWGATGAALGTVIGQCVSMAMSVNFFLLSGRSRLRLAARHFRPDIRLIATILSTGLPSLAQWCGQGLAIIAANRMLRTFSTDPTVLGYGAGGDLPINTYGLASRILLLLLFPVTGLAHGIQPIIGFNFGAGLHSRVRHTLALSMAITIAYGIASTIITAVWTARPMMRLFTGDMATIRLGTQALAIMGAATAFTGIQQIHATFLQSIGRRTAAMLVSVCGQLLVPPTLQVMGRFGLVGVWWAFPVAAVAGSLMSSLAVFHAIRGALRPSDGSLGAAPIP